MRWTVSGTGWISPGIGTDPLTIIAYDYYGYYIADIMIGGTAYTWVYLNPNAGLCNVTLDMPGYVWDGSAWSIQYFPEVATYTLPHLATVALPVCFGNSNGEGMLRLRTEELQGAIRSGAGPDDVITPASLHVMGESWMTQRNFASQIASSLFDRDVNIQSSCCGGMFVQDRADSSRYFVDMKHNLERWLIKDSLDAGTASFRAPIFLVSALEHGVLEQSQPGTEAVSTIKALALASRATQQVFRVTSSNWSIVEPQLSGYRAEEIQTFGDLATNQLKMLILPESGGLTLNSWTGSTYIAVDSNSMTFKIMSAYNGGYGSGTSFNPYATLYSVKTAAKIFNPGNIPHAASTEPVDLVTGAYLLDHDDLTLGGPLPLTLSRHYSSRSTDRVTAMGSGWMHSLDMRAEEHSDAQTRVRSPEDAAALMTGLIVTKDLLQNEDTAKGWLTASLTAQWLMNQLTGHTVSIVSGQKAYTFTEQPDGSYTPPPGMTVSLVKTNDVYVLQERNANTTTFNTNNLVAQIADPDGNTVTFTYNVQTNLQTVASSFGPTLTFGYYNTTGLLYSVTDNSSPARSVQYQYDSINNLTNFVDAAGKNWGISYNDAVFTNAITSLTDPENITTIQNFYNELGIVTQQVSATSNLWNFYIAGFQSVQKDPLGNRTVYDFDEQGRTLSVQNALSNRVSNSYDGQNHITNTVSEAGITNVFVYDVNHNLLKQRDAVGTPEERTTGYSYDSLNRLCFVTNALGTAEQTVTEYTYTATHHIDTITAAKGKAEERVTDLDYYGNGLLHVKTDPLRTTTFVYDVRGNPDTAASTDAGTVNLDYNEAGWLTQVTDQNSVITKYGHNALGLLTNTIHAYGTSVQVSESRTYYDNRLLKTVTDARNKTTQYLWNPAYKQAGAIYPDTGSTTNLYDAADRLTHIRDSKGNWTQFQLDAVGRITNTVGAITTVSAQYDPAGNVTNSVVDPSGLNLWKVAAYDALNRPLNQQSSIANQQFQYDSLSRLTNRVDPASKAWKTQYDALGQVKKTIRPSGSFEEYGYNALGERTQFWNAERKPMTFGVDAQGRVTAITNALDKVTSFEYDDAGNLTDRKDAKTQSTHYDYDALNRLTNVVHEGTWKASFEYDPNGNNVEQASPLASATFGYDEMNRLTNSTLTASTISTALTVSSSYDLNGNRTNIVYPGGLNVGYSYDAENRLTAVTAKNAQITKTFAFGYDGASRMTNIVYPNSVNSTFSYDAESRVVGFSHGSFHDREIIRDARGFKTSENIIIGLEPAMPEGEQRMVHNAADQLTKITQRDTWLGGELNQWYDRNYSYDNNGCLTQEAVTRPAWNTNSAIHEYSVDYAWDYDSRLASVTGGASPISTVYLYDASGSRIGRIANGVTNYFILDYRAPLKMPLAETDASGNVTRYYVWAGFRLLAHIAVDGGGDPVVRYYHQDEQGSTLALTDGNGTVTDQFAYTPYGKCTARTGTTGTPFQWLGGYGVYYDADTDLHLTLHRAYSADMRRFISTDPMGIDGGVNLYAYGNLNPTTFVDPYGLDSIVLNESAGAIWQGHQALAVQGAAGWIYLSQDGPRGGGGHTAYYNNQEEMMKDLGGRYDRHFLIQTTTQQDAAIYQSASANLSNPYSANPFDKNRFHCGDLVSTALQAGSVPTGSEPFGNRPNTVFNNIVSANTPTRTAPNKTLDPVMSFSFQTINKPSQGPLK